MIYRGPGFLAAYDLAPYPALLPATYRKTEKQRQLADGRGDEGDGRVAESYTTRKSGLLQIMKYSLVYINCVVNR